MHHDHHTRARDRPTRLDPTRPGSVRFGLGLCGVGTYIFWTIKLSCFRTVFFMEKLFCAPIFILQRKNFCNGKIINPPEILADPIFSPKT